MYIFKPFSCSRTEQNATETEINFPLIIQKDLDLYWILIDIDIDIDKDESRTKEIILKTLFTNKFYVATWISWHFEASCWLHEWMKWTLIYRLILELSTRSLSGISSRVISIHSFFDRFPFLLLLPFKLELCNRKTTRLYPWLEDPIWPFYLCSPLRFSPVFRKRHNTEAWSQSNYLNRPTCYTKSLITLYSNKPRQMNLLLLSRARTQI